MNIIFMRMSENLLSHLFNLIKVIILATLPKIRSTTFTQKSLNWIQF
ncbi:MULTISPECIES: hypothetical protein [unclassified Sphingobacterium]|nr:MULTISPECIES: hypothetical protein [unclassified Sphingobacterium]MDR6737384.1 hypothetical protein [Sphingobacterium sp. 2149]